MTASLRTIAAPSILQALCEWSRPLVLLHFVALVGGGPAGSAAEKGASAGLALTFFNCVVSYPTMGFACAFDTLTSQAFGAGRRDLLRGDLRIVATIACISSALTFALLLAVMAFVSPVVAPLNGVLVNEFLRILAPSIPATVVWNLLTRWLRAQHCSSGIVIGVVGGAALNFLMNAMPFPLVAGLCSATTKPFLVLAIANVAMLGPILVQAAIIWRRLHQECSELRKECSELRKALDYGRMQNIISLGMKGILLTCGEIWCWEIQVLFCSLLGPVAIAAYTISFNFYSFLVMVPVGLRTGLSVLIGYHIGRQDAESAEKCLKEGLYYLSGVVAVYFLAMEFFGYQIATLFSSSATVIEVTVRCFRVIALYQAFDGAYVVLVGALSGVGRQGVGAQATLAFYVVGIPLALLFGFPLQGGAAGLWIGMGLGNIVVFLIVLQQILKLDFHDLVTDAPLIANESG